MKTSALETYLAGVDPPAAPLVLALDMAVRKAHPDFDVASGVSIRAALVSSAALLGLALPLFGRARGQATGRPPGSVVHADGATRPGGA